MGPHSGFPEIDTWELKGFLYLYFGVYDNGLCMYYVRGCLSACSQTEGNLQVDQSNNLNKNIGTRAITLKIQSTMNMRFLGFQDPVV